MRRRLAWRLDHRPGAVPWRKFTNSLTLPMSLWIVSDRLLLIQMNGPPQGWEEGWLRDAVARKMFVHSRESALVELNVLTFSGEHIVIQILQFTPVFV